MISLFLGVVLSSCPVQEVPPSAVFFEHPINETVAVKVIKMLVDVTWDKPGYKASIDPRILIVGYDPYSIEFLHNLGWKAWMMKTVEVMIDNSDLVGRAQKRQFPFQKHALDVIMYELTMPTELFDICQLIVDVGRSLKTSGYFIIPSDRSNSLDGVFKSLNFWKIPLSLKYRDRSFSIYQKTIGRAA